MTEKELVKNILNKENLNAYKITKATSGFTNIVYFADEFVIKISSDFQTMEKLKKEVIVYKNLKLDCVPKYIASGEYNDLYYLIISKINGKGLFSIWHSLTKKQREDCIKQIASILKQINARDGSFLEKKYKMLDWKNLVLSNLEKNKSGLNSFNIDTSGIVVDETIFAQNKFGLVYNDAHFDNFIYDNGKIYLIDFDRVIYAPIDYEMMIFKTMCDYPKKFASEQDENVVFDEDFEFVYNTFKKYYGELFILPDAEQRIKVYQFNYLCDQALKMKNREIGEGLARKLASEF